jgi:hypothetical protein
MVSIDNSLSKIPWVVIFVIGVQFHFLAVIFPETRDYSIHIIGICLSVSSAAIILLLYFLKRRQQENISKMESLR